MADPDLDNDIRLLRLEIKALENRVGKAEARAEVAEHAAHHAEQEVLQLRDDVAAAQRDQQDLKTARARLKRIELRGLMARILNRR